MKINAHAIKISGAKIEVPGEFPVGTYDLVFRVKGDIVKEEMMDNQDGTANKTYILRCTEVDRVK